MILKNCKCCSGGDGEGGHQESVHQLIGVVGHCLNAGQQQQAYRFDIIKQAGQAEDGSWHSSDEPYIEGSTPHTVKAENAAAALHTLLVQSKTSLNYAVTKATGGDLIEAAMTGVYGISLTEDVWKRLGDHWDAVMAELQIPNGLYLHELPVVISQEIAAAKHLLTFGSMAPPETAAPVESEAPTARQKKRGRPARPLTPKERKIKKVHKNRQSREVTARLAKAFTRDGLPDVAEVRRVLRLKGE